MSVPVRSGQAQVDDIEALHARLVELEAVLGERTSEIVTAKSDLAAFRIRYRRDVGQLHEELDELESAIAEAELGEFSKRLESEADGQSRSVNDVKMEAGPRLTSDTVRRLFRDVAKTIHPDLARNRLDAMRS